MTKERRAELRRLCWEEGNHARGVRCLSAATARTVAGGGRTVTRLAVIAGVGVATILAFWPMVGGHKWGWALHYQPVRWLSRISQRSVPR